MKHIKKSLSLFIAAMFVMAGILGNVTAKAAIITTPKINYVGVDHSPLVVGDTEKFTVTSKYEGLVQYRAFLFDGRTWSELTSGYGAAVDAKTPYVLPETSPFKLGKYKLSVWVKKAGVNSTKNYDSYYVTNLNCLTRDDANRVYVGGAAKFETSGLTFTFKGIENIGGIKGHYYYRLNIFNPTTGVWESGDKGYTDFPSYTFEEAGTYMVIVQENTGNSGNWETYEAWKTVVVTVNAEDRVKIFDTTVKAATYGSTVNVTLTTEGVKNVPTAVQYQIFDGASEISAVTNLGADTTVFPSKASGNKVNVKLLDANAKEVKVIEVILGQSGTITNTSVFKYAIKPQFDSISISSFSEGLAIITIDGEYGMIDGKYGLISGKCGLIDKNGIIICEPQFEHIGPFSEGLASVSSGGKWGFIDKAGKIVIKPQFEHVYDFSGDLARVEVSGKFGFINKTGKIVIKPEFKSLGNFSEGVAIVRVGNKWGAIDKAGKIVIKPEFDNIGYSNRVVDFSEGVEQIRVINKWGLIDKTGKIVLKPQFASIYNFSEGLAGFLDSTKTKSKWGFIDKSGKVIIEAKYDFVEDFSEGIARVRVDGKWGIIDKTGKSLCEPQLPWIDHFVEGFAMINDSVYINGKWGFISKNGEILCKPQFDKVTDFSEGLAIVKVNDKYGVIDTSGKIVIKPEFDGMSNFNEGLASVNVDGKGGFIDKTGKIIIKPEFEGVGDFIEGLAEVRVNGKWGAIDNSGKIIIEPQFNDAIRFSEGLGSVYIGGNYGYINNVGKIIIKPQFGEVKSFSDGLAIVKINGKWGVIINPLTK